jgi:exo-beta-1,3-glucanase (GH17 family)
VEPTTEDIRRDLITLRQAGFSGLVTYGATGAMGRELPKIAESLGFEGLIMGIWDPGNQDELKIALSQSNSPIVLGYCVGNEGLKLHDTDEGKRYDWATLLAAMQKLHQTAKKPVTTTEEVEDYLDENLLKAGDWVFPNLHPYFHRILEPNSAVRWTLGGYEDLVRRSRLFVWLKECGLPTAGDGREPLSETAQDQYYAELAKTPAKFVFFEAFDLPWKDHLPVEPHWGIFKSDRTPKILGARLMKNAVPTVAVNSDRIISPTIFSKESFVVYEDFRSENNHFTPSGYMGDVGDVQINESFESNPRSGKTSIQVKYTAKGGGPHQCSYAGPCKWAGVYWQNPANNWGEKEQFKGQGFDLSGFTGLRFWARAEKQAVIEFKVGGISQRFGDSLTFPRSIRVKLTEDWKEYEIKLDGANLKHIIGGFCWSADWNSNPNGAIFYLDDIRFEDERVKR